MSSVSEATKKLFYIPVEDLFTSFEQHAITFWLILDRTASECSRNLSTATTDVIFISSFIWPATSFVEELERRNQAQYSFTDDRQSPVLKKFHRR